MRYLRARAAFLCVIYLAFWSASAFGQKSAEALTELEGVIREEIARRPFRPDAETEDDQRLERGYLSLMQLRPALGRVSSAEVDGLLNQVPISFPSDKVRASVDKLRAALQTEREEKEKALVEKIEGILVRASKAVETAGVPADLDNTLYELSPLPEQRDAISEKARVSLDRLRSAHQFTIHWQDYIDHMAAGRADQARNSLNVANTHTVANLLPRSVILERLAKFNPKTEDAAGAPLPRLREIMAKAKSLADLPATIDAVAEFRLTSGKASSDNPVAALSNELLSIQHCYKEFQHGLPTLLEVRPANGYPAHGEAIELALPLKVELMRLVFPRFLRVDQAAREGEPIDDYVARMMQFAFDQVDPRLILRVLELRRAINASVQSTPFSPGLDALLAARNQEDAGQFLPAVISYQRALRRGGEYVPAKAIGARLDAIKAAHPIEYEAGMKVYLAEPEPAPPMIQGSSQSNSVKVPGAEASPEPVAPRSSPTPP